VKELNVGLHNKTLCRCENLIQFHASFLKRNPPNATPHNRISFDQQKIKKDKEDKGNNEAKIFDVI
jgi:hypothetical protein